MAPKSPQSFLKRVFKKEKPTAISNDQIGLKLLNPVPVQTEIEASDALLSREADKEICNADVVAVHGLGGHAYNTWTHENGVMWLRDIACRELPGARLYTFGYDSGVAFSRGTSDIRGYANSLLEELRRERQTVEVSPNFMGVGDTVPELALI
jgi:hypothetical protein